MQKLLTLEVVACGLLMLVAGGCGPSRPATATVSGRVTFNGKPVAAGQIVFYPETGRPAMSAINADGRYHLTTFKSGDGAMLGRHRVTIEATRVSSGPTMPKTMEEEMNGHGFAPSGPPRVEWLAPVKYSNLQTSPLTAEVKSGENTINFDLPK